MATQWNYDFSPGEVLTAGVMDSLGAVWETWTPTLTPQLGSYTTATVNTARYGRIGKLVYCQIVFTITTIGTGSGIALFTLPITGTTPSFLAMGSYREIGTTGLVGIISQESTTTAAMRRYDNVNALTGSGNKFAGSFFYEAS
jgi:hypothetical protein